MGDNNQNARASTDAIKQSILKINNLTMRFGGLLALQNVSFEVKKNSITALIGPNGAGKTTVFNCITGFYQPDEGNLLFLEERKNKSEHTEIEKIIGKVRPKTLNPIRMVRNIYNQTFGGTHLLVKAGLVRTFQNVRLFSDMTVIENLLVGQHLYLNKSLISGLLKTKSYRESEKNAVDKAYFWIDRLRLSHVANQLARNLPYGEQRRLEIARAMCTDPYLLCLDEPAAGLNNTETEDLSNIIKSLRKEFNISILLIEHDMSMVMGLSDHIVVLDHGEVIALGIPEDIRNSAKVIQAYLGTE